MAISNRHLVAWVALVAGCSPQSADKTCPIDSGDFAFRSIAGGPVRKPGEARLAVDDLAPGDDHGDGHEPTEGPWLPGEPEVGVVSARDRIDLDNLVIHRDAWRPARTRALAPWNQNMRPPTDDEATRGWLESATCEAMAPEGSPILWWLGAEGEWLGEGAWLARCNESKLMTVGVERCVDESCLLKGPAGGLIILRQGKVGLAIAGVAEGWRGAGTTIKAFSRALSAARVAPYESELGEVLSIEEAGRLSAVEGRLEALAKAYPDHYFLTYFVARNRAGQKNYAGAMALLEALVANPAPEAIAARAMTGLHEEWAHLRANNRYQVAQEELHRRIPDDVGEALAWLVRFRRSIPHLNAAILNGGLSWLDLREVVRIAALYPARWRDHTAVIPTPDGTHIIEFSHDPYGTSGVRRVVLNEGTAAP